MKKYILLKITVTIAIIFCCFAAANARHSKVLIFSKTAGFHHASIPAGIAAIQKLGAENHFSVDTTTDSNLFTNDNLKKYAAVIFLNTTGDVLNNAQQKAFENYIRNGGGFVGVHAATDTEYDWSWYGNLVGAYFKSHPKIQQATLEVVDHNFPGTKNLPDRWTRTDEWYNYKWIANDLHVLIKIDESSYKGGENDDNHPMCWYHNFDGGRAFYVEMGHTDESYSEPPYLHLLLSGIKYAMHKH
ncbi:Crp/Fnr family transcriptional regulator [Arachidicoccus ginsenosidimutans]|uniref:ThuA domain-containing protein n=1 Tax=Arachidicoccus sp. BS20 TaxID=1850526 RepID=UPI0007F0F726|nr:ThuA domain-containing protein [Arachidicoccus sp. BS20]ANI90771.1 Crp/Fnr family transcriptional regulator [Arachidicoccus sp. BS20]